MTFMTSVVQISALKTKPYKYMFVDETKSRYYITSHTEITSVLNRLIFNFNNKFLYSALKLNSMRFTITN